MSFLVTVLLSPFDFAALLLLNNCLYALGILLIISSALVLRFKQPHLRRPFSPLSTGVLSIVVVPPVVLSLVSIGLSPGLTIAATVGLVFIAGGVALCCERARIRGLLAFESPHRALVALELAQAALDAGELLGQGGTVEHNGHILHGFQESSAGQQQNGHQNHHPNINSHHPIDVFHEHANEDFRDVWVNVPGGKSTPVKAASSLSTHPTSVHQVTPHQGTMI